jgi:hypothetical protein
MDRTEQLRRLPLALAVALRLHEAGADETLIAAALAIEPEGVGPLLQLARAKLDRIARREPDEGDEARLAPGSEGPSTKPSGTGGREGPGGC